MFVVAVMLNSRKPGKIITNKVRLCEQIALYDVNCLNA